MTGASGLRSPEKPLSLVSGPGGLELAGHVEIIPADDAVSDDPVAAFGDLLFGFVGMFETARISDRDGPGETVRTGSRNMD